MLNIMKKIFLLCSLFISFLANAQIVRPNPTINFQQFGTPITLTRINGILYPVVGYAPALYADTSDMNLTYLDAVPLAEAGTTDGKTWRRNYACTRWDEFLTGSNFGSFSWSLIGNSGTTAGTNFVGTTDAQPLQFRTNNVLAAIIPSGGFARQSSNLYRYMVYDTTNKIWGYKDGVGSITSLGTGPASLTNDVLNIPRDQLVGPFLNPNKTFTEFRPLLWGDSIFFSGNSWASGAFSLGTPWAEQIRALYNKVAVYNAQNGADLTYAILANQANQGVGAQNMMTFVELTFLPASNSAISGIPYLGLYYFGEATQNNTKSYKYYNGGWRYLIANHYLKSVSYFSSLADANFRNSVASDSIGSKSTNAVKGLGSVSINKAAGETTQGIAVYGADGTRNTAGVVTIKCGSDTLYSKSFNERNNSNKALVPYIKTGLSYDAIVLTGLPDSAQTLDIIISGDSTWLDWYGPLYPPGDHNRRLFISNIPYGAGGSSFTFSRSVVDTFNINQQRAVEEFPGYPVVINNANGFFDSITMVQANFHLTAAGNDAYANNYFQNLVPVYKAPASSFTSFVSSTLSTFGAGARLPGDTAAFTDSTLYGSFYNDGQDTLIITAMRIVMQGTNDTLTINVEWNDSLNVTGTKLKTAYAPANNNYTGNSYTLFDNTKIPPGNWVWCKSPYVLPGRRPNYLSVTLIGYKKRI